MHKFTYLVKFRAWWPIEGVATDENPLERYKNDIIDVSATEFSYRQILVNCYRHTVDAPNETQIRQRARAFLRAKYSNFQIISIEPNTTIELKND